MRDYQQTKVYQWEYTVVAQKDTQVVPFAQLQMLTNYIWEQEGLSFPPKIVLLPKNVRNKWACADRLHVQAPAKGLPTWVLIHELTHSMTLTHDRDDIEAGHGPIFVGTYMRLLEKHLRIPLLLLMASARANHVDFDITASSRLKD